ncbi:Pr6Pr family membrane protein [Nocardia goodfellowii]
MGTEGQAASWIRLLRVGFALLGLIALVHGPVTNWDDPGYSLANFFSYFTIQSNVIAFVVLAVGGLWDPQGRSWRLFRGAATLYMIITGVVYAVLLADIDVSLSNPSVNHILHRVIPLVMLADWLLVPVVLGVSARLIGSWLLYPLAYGAYTLVRGWIVDWYPYPFIDPREKGYLHMGLGLIALAVVFAILAVAVAALGDWAARSRRNTV